MAVLAAELAACGAGVQVTACDAADRAALAGLLAAVPAGCPLTGVIHAAGILDDGVTGSLTPARVQAVMRPKADAAWHLHELTRDTDLDMFILFSSAAATLGTAGQGNYAAGNAFLDALAAYRRAAGLPATSLAWGLWADASAMTGHLGSTDRARMAREGLAALSAADGLALLDAAVARDEALLVAARLDMAGLRASAARGQDIPLLWRTLVPQPGGPLASGRPAAATGRDAAGGLRRQLAGLPGPDRDKMLLDVVRAHAAAVIGHASAEAIEPGRAFRDMGFDSLTAVELRNRLNAATGLRLPATLVFDYPAPVVLAEFLRSRLLGDLAGDEAAPAVTAVSAAGEPVAIVGMSCRFPGGVTDPEGLWELLATGTDAVSGFPADRGWDLEELYDPDPDHPGTSYTRQGGFLDDASGFDAGFFGISPREALAMDPQQRLLLEICWEALERAGIDPGSLRGSRTGVFAGAASFDYRAGLSTELEGHRLTGTATSVISGRVAYALGLEGPAVTVDTACSSSLVALHLACQALRAGECDLALAGGVTVMATPGPFVEFSRQRGLSADGRCKAFSAAADGMGAGEGVGMVLVERLSDARRCGHRVLAVIAGSAVNSDGASNGLTAPNGPSQQRVIRAALASARLSAGDVDAVEAHGTGTRLGDPIEAQALLATYGQERSQDQPLWLGSVKSNISHAQCAAGVAGVIKMVLALQHGLLPGTLHAAEPSPHVDWSAGSVRLLTEAVPWPADGRPRRAGVSSFGISGTNAHAIVAEAPAESGPGDDGQVPAVPGVEGAVAWVVSARSAEGLAAQAARLAEFAEAHPELDPVDVGWSLVTTRSLFEHRAVVIGGDREELATGLAAVVAGEPAGGVVTGVAGEAGKVVFVFPGQGGQWAGMARELTECSPVFAARLAECGRALAPYVDWSLEDVIAGAPGAPGLDRVDVVQPALWAVMVSLAALWQAAGVDPDAVAGHSQGEIAAATVAGVLSVEDGAKVVALRSRALRALAGRGGMISVAEPAARVRERLAPWGERLSVAAVNGPAATVVSGDSAAVGEFAAACAAAGVRTKPVPVDYASHCAQVESIREEILAALAEVTPGPAQIPVISAMTGEFLHGPEVGAGYWYDSLRQPVEFDRAVRVLAGSGYRVFVEVSPHPVLAAAVSEAVEDAAGSAAAPVTVTVTGTLRRDDGGARRFLSALAEVHVGGTAVDWARVLGRGGGRRVDLPTYAFQHQRYWPAASAAAADVRSAGLSATGHPLLGAEVGLADGGGYLLTSRLSLQAHPWLADHAVSGTVLLPGTAFAELAVRAGGQAGCARIEELALEAPLVLPAQGAIQLQVVVSGPDEAGRRTVQVYSRPELRAADAPWTRHASGTLAPAGQAGDLDAPGGDPVIWPPRGARPLPAEGLYERLAAAGYGYGPAFRGLRAAWQAGDKVFAEVRLPEEVASQACAFGLHPALLDSALHAVGVLIQDLAGHAMLPFAWSGVSLHVAGASALRVRLRKTAGDAVSLTATDEAGSPVVSVDSLVLRPVAAGQLKAARDGTHDALFTAEWVPLPATSEPAAGRWAVIGTDSFELAAGLAAAGVQARAHEGLAALAEAIAAGEPVPDVVLACAEGLDGTDHRDAAVAARTLTNWMLSLVQRWLADDRLDTARLVVVTRGAVAAEPGEDVSDLAAAAARGLVRSAQSENPGRLVLADLDTAGESAGTLAAALACGEPELAIRAHVVYGRRLARAQASGLLTPPADGRPWRLDSTERGGMRALALVASPQAAAPLEAGQVRVAVRAAGLNARDVRIAQGTHPGPAEMGSEIAGIVTETGPGVAGLAVGDRVMGLADGGFGPVAVADARLLARIPVGWSFAQAAALPVSFLPGETDPGRLGQALAQVAGLLAAGELDPLPVRAWDVRRAPEAFRFMSQARHVGKVVLTIPPDPAAPRQAGTVLVTGGTGTLGGLVAGHLAVTGRARDLVLASRSGPAAPDVAALAASLAARGTGVRVTTCDTADRTALAGLLAGIRAGSPLTWVVHAAGVLDDGVTGSLTPARVDAVMRPKADAAWHLHELTQDIDLQEFVLFSSGAATFGNAGQGNYAAGNAFLDALAARRRAAGLTGVSLAWGLWADASAMTGHLSVGDKARMAGGGVAALAAEEGLALLDAALSRDDALLVPARLDVAGLRARATRAENVPTMLRGLVPLTGASARSSAVSASGAGVAGAVETLRRQLAGRPGPERDRVLLGLVRAHVAAVLGHASPEAVEPGRAFSEIGFDSLTALKLRNQLAAATGLRLPATVVFDYPAPVMLAAFLRAELLGDSDEVPAAPAATASAEPVAIVGMSCRFPGGVSSPEELWELVVGGTDTVSGFPADRGWDTDGLFDPDPDHPGTSYVRAGGFLTRAGDFDPSFFGISPREALAMDPQQRLLLETSWEAFERAGIEPGLLRGSPTGVFVGATSSGYGEGLPTELEGHLLTGAAASVASGRVAYTFGLEGPAVTVDTACSSSLVALHLACQALRAGECSLALAGGVTVMVTPVALVGFSRQRGLAADGRCKPFSAAADGMGMAEGIGMLVVERLSDAQRNGHRVLAVVRGSAVNSDGASNGLTAPNGPSQQRVIRAALASAKVSAAEVDAVEAHGTGTRAGRPDRGAGAAGHLRAGPPGGPAAVAGVGEVQHRPCPVGGGGGRGDQDGAGPGAWPAATVAARGRAVPARGLVVRSGAAAGRADGVACGRASAAGGGVLVRGQRHQRPPHHRRIPDR